MTVSSIKALLWLVTLGVVGYLGYTIYDWRENQASILAAKATPERQLEILSNVEKPEPPKQQIHPYKESIEPNFFVLNWTGKLPPPPPPPPGPEDTKPEGREPATPIADLLVVQFVQVDTSRPELSKACIKYTDASLSTKVEGEPQWLRPGDALHEPHQLWTVHEIKPNQVVFRRLLASGEPDEEEADQTASPPTAFDGDMIVAVGPDGAILPSRQDEYFPPLDGDAYRSPDRNRTVEVKPNYFQVGIEDKQQFNERYLDILSTEVRTRTYRENGKAAGIYVDSVVPGSLAAQHGAQVGDVIKSINGTPVNSTQEAISYVKNNKDQYSVWEVVVWNSGKERTVTYNVP